jgi:hypothetical protein
LKFMDSVGAAGGDFFKSGFDIFGFDLVVHKTKNKDENYYSISFKCNLKVHK